MLTCADKARNRQLAHVNAKLPAEGWSCQDGLLVRRDRLSISMTQLYNVFKLYPPGNTGIRGISFEVKEGGVRFSVRTQRRWHDHIIAAAVPFRAGQ